MPDTVFSDWDNATADIAQALGIPPAIPIVPKSLMDQYSGRPLRAKLGIKTESIVCLGDHPQDFETLLTPVPEGSGLNYSIKDPCDMALWFVRSTEDLNRAIETMVESKSCNRIWFIWPKKCPKAGTELSQQVVREAGLLAGLAYYKVCSIDPVCTGLLFKSGS